MELLTRIIAFILILLPLTVMDNEGKEIEELTDYRSEIVEEYITIYSDTIVGTVYHPVPRQTDSTPFLTADHTTLNPKTINEDRIVALSRNLIYHKDSVRDWCGIIPFGATILVESPHEEINGEWTVHDTMNKRYDKNIDFIQNHKDKSSLYGKWYGLTLKAKVTKQKFYINNILIHENIIDSNGLNI